MRKSRFVVGSGAVVVAVLAVAVPAVAGADAAAMGVTASGNTLTISGTCPRGGTDAEAWYGKPGGHEPIRTAKMKNSKGKLSATFTNVAPGTYQAVMGCQTASNTAVKTVKVLAKTAAKKKPKGAPKTGGGPALVWLSR